MNSVDLSKTIVAKSDQLNADDLIGGPITVTIREVRGHDDADQPISIYFEGDCGKPYKPCKTMRRVLVLCWSAEGQEFIGRRMTLYRDPAVAFGGIAVGGIRITHMSHIDREKVLPLTVTRGKKAPYKVSPLKAEVRQAPAAQRAQERAAPELSRADPPTAGVFEGGFGAGEPVAGDEDVSEAVLWSRGVFEDLDGDVFQATADIDAFFRNPKNVEMHDALKAEDEALAKRVVAALNGRGKALASRR